jgi:glyoxylase-like metal-dependent hydrolase (beta-lactamase superfamily II)
MSVEAVLVGEGSAPRAWIERPDKPRALALADVLRPGAPSVNLSYLWFVIRHPREGVILVDTGLHPDALRSISGDYGRLMGVMFRTLRPRDGSFPDQLAARGLEGAEVRRVVMTHLHVDHTSGMRLLPNAEFVVGGREWRAATGARSQMKGYARQHLPPPERVRQVDLGAEGVPHGPFSKTLDLLGDGTVRLIATPGHSPGHLSVLVELDGPPVLIVGDAVYTLHGLEHDLVPFSSADEDAYRRSMGELRAYAAAHPEAILVPTHDENAWRRLS